MSLDILDLKIHGIPSKLMIPEFSTPAQNLKKMYTTRPNYEYEAVMVALLHKILTSLEQPTFADIGPFIGFYTIFAAKLLQHKGQVVAFESNPQYLEALETNLGINEVSAQLVHAALSDRVETLRFQGSAISGQPDFEGQEIQAETLDAICQRLDLTLDVAKMDVHGFEGKILGGMPELLRGPLKYLLMELHPNLFLEKFTPGLTRMKILDMLEEAGFRNYYIAGHRYTWSDGMRKFFQTGQFAYQPLTKENRGMLLFDRHNHVFVLSSKTPLEDLIGPSILDPSAE